MRIGGARPIDIAREPGADKAVQPSSGGDQFVTRLATALNQVDSSIQQADKVSIQAAQGKVDIHEAALALERADLQMRMVVKVRNKVVDAYREIMRLSV